MVAHAIRRACVICCNYNFRCGSLTIVQESVAVERGSGELEDGEALASEGGGACALLGVEGAVVLAVPAEAPTVALLVDLGLRGGGSRGLRRCVHECVHRVPFSQSVVFPLMR